MEFLNNDEIERIHRNSIKVLEEIGISLHSEQASKMLEDAGCTETADGKRILIPQEIVASALSSAPKSVLLAARKEGYDIRVPSDEKMYVANGGEGIYVKNMLTGESHPSTSEDIRDFMMIVEELPQIDFAWTMVGALEQPRELKELIELKVGLEYTSKHVQSGALEKDLALQIIELGALLAGDEEALRKRPIFSVIQCPISPLAFDKGLIEAQIEFSQSGIPVVAMSASLAGLTSPVTIVGTMVQVNAENLASLVISQVASEGAPWIYSSDSSPADFATGSIDYHSIEGLLLRTGFAQIGQFYRLPTMTGAADLAEEALNIRNITDALPRMMLQALIPSDLGAGMGGIDMAVGASLEVMVADAWVWELAREFVREFESDEDALAFDTIKEAAVDGTYLNKAHTLQRFRKEFISSKFPEVKPTEREKVEERGSLIRKARAEAERILKKKVEPVVSKDESRAMNEFIKKFKRK